MSIYSKKKMWLSARYGVPSREPRGTGTPCSFVGFSSLLFTNNLIKNTLKNTFIMRTIIIITILASSCTLLNAQLASNVQSVQDDYTSDSILKTNAAHTETHTKALTKKIYDYALQNIQYSELLTENALEGNVEVELSLNEFAEIVDVKILKSFSSLADEVVLEKLKSFQVSDYPATVTDRKKLDYKGNRTIQMTLNFSLK